MFLFKKIVAPFLFPLSICLEILLAGLYALWFTRSQKRGKIIVTIGVILLATISYGAVSNLFLGPLESKYQPILDALAFQNVKWVVVLGGGHVTDPRLSVTDQLSDVSLIRLVEGIRIHKKLFSSKLLLSGGEAFSSTSDADTMAKMAMALGIEKKEIVLESESKDTKDQAKFIQNIIGDNRFILVTSASHMARSVSLFKAKGMNPIPAPVGFQIKNAPRMSPMRFFPSGKGIDKMERVVYEYLGIEWARLRGQINTQHLTTSYNK
jgi:uncharacterized SAM-binding protein YcdF (DUF218 family)